MQFYKHLKITFRNLYQNLFYTATSVIGLASGFTVALFIGLFIHYEHSYDNFFKDNEQIYRVALQRIYPNSEKTFSTTSIQLAQALRGTISEVQAATRLHRQFFENEVNVVVDENDKSFSETKFLYADSVFFDVFSYEFIHGDSKQSLIWPYAVVLTSSTAIRYFGNTDVLDKSISIDGQMYLVTGVIRDIPKNSHIQFDLLGSIFALDALSDALNSNNWSIPWVYTYVELAPDTDPKKIGFEIENILKTQGLSSLKRDLGENFESNGHFFAHFLQSIQSIHLYSDQEVELQPNGDIFMLWIVGLVGFAILVLSGINFINLSISRTAERSKEAGIRKVLGANRLDIVFQFLIESFIICLIAAIFAVSILYFISPFVSQLMGFTIDFYSLWEIEILFSFSLIILIVSFFAGFFPASLLSAMEVSLIIKGVFQPRNRGIWLRKFLVGLQFFISIAMITLSLLVIRQINFIQNEPLGFNKEDIIVIKNTDRFGIDLDELFAVLKSSSEFLKVGSGSFVPGDFHSSNLFKFKDSQDREIRANTCFADNAYVNVMQFELLSGTFFPDLLGDTIPILINETAAKTLLVPNALGKVFTTGMNEENNVTYYQVVGVIKDYHFASMDVKIGPLILIKKPAEYPSPNLILRVKPELKQQAEASLITLWNGVTKEELNYFWLNERLADMYEPIEKMIRVFAIFTFIAIVLSCTGLYGLASYKVTQRNREMVIRKVLGSSLTEIIWLFYQDFGKVILYSFLLSTPVAYMGYSFWVKGFAYQATLSVYPFIYAGFIALFLVIFSVSYQAVRLAYIQPMALLRSE